MAVADLLTPRERQETFHAQAKKHTSVAETRKTGGYFAQGYFARYFPRGYFAEGDLIIELEDDAARELGVDRFTAVELAQRVLDFWKQRLETPA